MVINPAWANFNSLLIKKPFVILPLRLCICFLLMYASMHAQSDWHMSKEKDGIKVFTRKTEGSSLKSIKVEATLQGNWQKLYKILIDVKNQSQWVYHTKNSYPIKQVSNNEVLYYTETALPWPVSNRDAVIRMKITYDPSQHLAQVLSRNEANILPPKNDLVRIPYYKATWDVRPVDANKIFITYLLELDPGGSLPSAVVNMFVTTGPFETFSKLAQLLKQ
jgi:hypothetical protein